MSHRLLWLTAILTLAAGGAVLSLTSAQPPAPAPAAIAPAKALRPGLDPTKLPKQEALFCLAAQRGADWLQRCNRPDGRFGYVNNPTLRTRQENDFFTRQAGAASALGKAASLFADERGAVLATQAVLTLLVETSLDEAKRVRVPSIRASSVSPLAAAGALLQAIHDLPNPGTDLLNQSEQLCEFIRLQHRSDGGLGEEDLATAAEALYGLMRSHQQRPAAWKLELMRKAHAYYQPRWQANRSLTATPRLCAAWTDAYQYTKEQQFAESVFAMADWLAALQYQQLEPARASWYGGFQGWSDGKATNSAPDVASALFAQALADGRRVARLVPDAQRHKRYQDALERGLQFVLSLQYTQSNTQHFADWYRSEMLGAFHASHQDGNVRLDYTHQAVAAFVSYFR